MIVYGIVNQNGNIAVDQDERLILFRLRKAAKRIKLEKGEKIKLLEVRETLDGRTRRE